MLILATGSYLDASKAQLSNPIVLSGLTVEFIGTIWLVLCLNQRRKKSKL
jgi:DMSO reductase anchor subunit